MSHLVSWGWRAAARTWDFSNLLNNSHSMPGWDQGTGGQVGVSSPSLCPDLIYGKLLVKSKEMKTRQKAHITYLRKKPRAANLLCSFTLGSQSSSKPPCFLARTQSPEHSQPYKVRNVRSTRFPGTPDNSFSRSERSSASTCSEFQGFLHTRRSVLKASCFESPPGERPG